MQPTRPRDDAAVDLLDVLLRDGAVLSADVVVTVADVPLVGIKLRAAIAGMRTMTDHGMLVDLDRRARDRTGEGGGPRLERAGAEDRDRERDSGSATPSERESGRNQASSIDDDRSSEPTAEEEETGSPAE